MMRQALTLLALLTVTGVAAQPGTSVLQIRVTLADAAQGSTPVSRHVLLVSDNPATAEPRRILTAADGTVALPLRPGSYIVESDRPAVFGGRAYQWTQVVDIVAGRDASLELTMANAEVVPLDAVPSPAGGGRSDGDALLAKWQDSVVTVWSPTARASGFVVDSRGLIATDGRAIGAASVVAVQLTPAVKVPARVLHAERSRDVAIIWVEPSLIAAAVPLPLACPPTPAPALEDGQELASIVVPLVGVKELERGEVVALQARRVETDLRVAFGESGGPVFNDAGVIVGLTSVTPETDRRRDDAVVIRTVFVCEALARSLPLMAGASPLAATRLPVEPGRSYPVSALEDGPRARTASPAVPLLSSSDFDVAFVTPPMVHRARQRAGWTGSTSGRSPEAEARLGQLTEFGVWSGYFDAAPAVLVVRVTPKLVEGFWKRLGREAARTQGAELPPFKDFKTSFRELRATCAGQPVTPIHPLVLEHRVSEKNLVREGLYLFDPDALGPHCGTVTLSLYSEAQPDRADTLTVTRAVVDQIWSDFAPYRAAAR